MNIRRIRKEISSWTSSGRRITEKRLIKLDTEFAKRCVELRDRLNKVLSEIVWWLIYGRPTCPICGNFTKYLGSHQQGFNTFCSSKCAGQSEDTKTKRKKTNLKTYGQTSPSKIPEIRSKQRAIMKHRYGVECGGQLPEFVAKAKATLLEHYGVAAPLLHPDILNKAKITWTRNYGVDHPMKNREYFESQQKSGFKIRKVRIGGKKFRVRGFEPYAIRYLVKRGFDANNILTTAAEGVPSIPYFDKTSGKNRVYHPDMLVMKDGRKYIVEVKSTYTAGLMRRKRGHRSGTFSLVRARASACVAAGWRFKLLVVTKNKRNKSLVVISDLHEKSRKQVREEFSTKAKHLLASDL